MPNFNTLQINPIGFKSGYSNNFRVGPNIGSTFLTTPINTAQLHAVILHAPQQESVESSPEESTDTTTSNYQGLFSGNMRSYQERKNWVQQHKDYLRSKDSSIDWDNYTGGKEANLALSRLLGGDTSAWTAKVTPAATTAVTAAPISTTTVVGGPASTTIDAGAQGPAVASATPASPASDASAATEAEEGVVADPYTRSKTGVYQDAEGNIDWTRSVKPEDYMRSRLNDIQSAYATDMDRLRSTFNGHMTPELTAAYWKAWRQLRSNRRDGRRQARQAGTDYQNAYNDYIYGLIGKAPNAGVAGESRTIPESDKTINPYFTYTTGNFKIGGTINYQKIFK